MSKTGDLIKKTREKQGISLRTFAGKMQLSPGYISDVENGKSKLTVINMQGVKDILFSKDDQTLYDAFAIDHDDISIDIKGYILDNDLQQALRILMEKDGNGQSLIELAMHLNEEKTKR